MDQFRFICLIVSLVLLMPACQPDGNGSDSKDGNSEAIDPGQTETPVSAINFSNEVNILQPGLYHGEDVFEGAAELNWHGLYTKGNTSEIRPVGVTFDPAFDPILDILGEETAVNITDLADTAEALLLISGIETDGPFVVMSGFQTNNQWPVSLVPGQSFRIGDNIRLEAYGEGMEQYRLDLILESNKIEAQTLASAEALDDTYMSVHWAGDLNGDGYVDVLLDISPKYSYGHLALFLSNAAAGGQLSKTAEFVFTGC